MKKICEYGCKQEATHQFKNGKWCCNKNIVSCPEIKRKNSEALKNPDINPAKRSEIREKIRERMKGDNNPSKRLEVRKKNSDSKKGKKNFKHSERMKGDNNPSYKGTLPFAHIDYIPKLEKYEEVRIDPNNPNIINVKCKYCGKWHRPFGWQVANRIQSIKGAMTGENNFYCSEICKNLCPIFNFNPNNRDPRIIEDEIKQEKEFILLYTKQLIKKRDIICQRCGINENLEVHHIVPIKINPLLANDIENCILFCEECHKWVHINIEGCGYQELRNIKCKEHK